MPTQTHRWLAVLLPALLTSTACYSDADSFIRGVAKHGCKRARECDKSSFERAYDDLNECRDDSEDAYHDTWDLAQDLGCEYIPEEGRECVKALRKNRKDCSSDADEEIAAECGAGILGTMLDYLDCD